jgi:hypothetical protein
MRSVKNQSETWRGPVVPPGDSVNSPSPNVSLANINSPPSS